MKSDNDLALTSVIESWSTLRAMESGSRMIIGNCLVGSSKSNGFVEGAIQLVQGIIRTVRRAIEEKLETSRGRRLVITHQQVNSLDEVGTDALNFGGAQRIAKTVVAPFKTTGTCNRRKVSFTIWDEVVVQGQT